MIFDDKYSDEVMKDFGEILSENQKSINYALDVDGGFNTPPVTLMFKFMSDPTDFEMQNKIAHACIRSRKVSVLLDGNVVGSPFISNSLDDPWENFQVLQQHPIAFSLLINNSCAFVVKKYKPPVINMTSPPQVAETKA